MFLKASSGLYCCIAVLLVVSASATMTAGDSTVVSFDGSIKKISAADQAAPPQAHRPRISRKVLQPAEVASEMDFEVALKMRSFSDLQKRVGHGQRVPRAEMSDKHYPLEGDYRRVLDWLVGQGFKIRRQDSNRLAIFARGSVQQIQKSLKVDFARVTMDGKEYNSAISAPQVPANLAGAILSINGLQPHLQAHKHVLPPQAARPNSLTDTNPPYLPSQIAQAYDAQSLYTAGIDGTGQTIGIVIDTFPLQSDLTTFWQTYNVNQSLSNIQFIQVVFGTLPSQSGEESLDVEWSSSIAPGAKVRVYATTDLSTDHLDEAYSQIFDDVTNHPEYGLHQISLSYGLGEQYASAGQVSTDSQYFANLASAGVTIFVSSGDGGSTPGLGPAGDTSGPVQTETPASDPNVTSVGGTSLNLNSTSNISSESAWNLGGGGTSIFFFRPTWQTGNGVPAGTMRTVPDVSCAADSNTGAYVTLNGLQTVFGGTSWSSPTWAGFCALMNHRRANANLPPLGLLGPKIYPLLGTGSFHDIITGSNGNLATVGYDLATGLGTPDVQNLSQALLGVQTTPVAQTLAPGSNANFTVVATGTITSYQWQRLPIGSSQWSNVTDSVTYSGSNSATLTVVNVSTAMSGDQFRCQINNGSPVTSNPPSVLVVDKPLVVSTLAGQPLLIGSQDGAGSNAQFSYPSGVAVVASGDAYIADFNNDTIRKVTPLGVVSTPYGQTGFTGASNGAGNAASFNTPNSVASDSAGNLYVADSGNSTIRKINTSGVVSLFAGRAGFTGTTDSNIGSQARFNQPQGVTTDSAGNIYVADTFNYTIRKITPSGSTSTLAGNAGTNGYADGVGAAAVFNGPFSLAVDSQGNVYVGDLYNFVIRKITPAGVVTTPYGQPGVPGRLDGVGNGALFNAPMGVTIDANDNLYVMDSQIPPITTSTSSGNNLVRKITPAGVVSTIAGSPGVTGSSDGMGSDVQFYSLQSATVSSAGVLYLADTFNQIVRLGASSPVFTQQPASASILQSQSVTFSTAFAGITVPTLQWQRKTAAATDWSNVVDQPGTYSGSSTNTLTITGANTSMNGDRFQCIISTDGITPLLTTNTATLTVQTGYGQWASSFFTPQQMQDPNTSGPTATPQGDGIANLLKYLFGINPTVAMSSADYQALPVAGQQTVSGTPYLTLTYRQNQTTAGLSIAVQTSTDLIHWQTVTPDSTQTISTDQATGDPIIQIKVQTQNATGLFARLQVTSS